MGEHTEKWFVWLRQKQGRDAHLERKGMGVPRNESESESESHSVMSVSLQPHGLYIVHAILQVGILECVPILFSRGSSQPRDQTRSLTL